MRVFCRSMCCLCCFCLLLLAAAGGARAAGADTPLLGVQEFDKTLAASKGKVVLINFFATWCPPCSEEIPGLIKLRQHFPADRLTIIGASLDEDASLVPPFVKRMKITYPVFRAQPALPARYGVRSIPHNVIYGPDGKVVANVTGIVTEEDLRAFIDKLLQ